MKTILAVIIALFCSSFVYATVSVDVYKADGSTPLELVDPGQPHTYVDIMVDTKLVIYVSSDDINLLGFDLAAIDANIGIGQLYGRGPIAGESDYSGSHYPAAGDDAAVYSLLGYLGPYEVNGFDLSTGTSGTSPGRWFVLDYNSIQLAPCEIAFFDWAISEEEPVYYLKFNHVRTRDFYADYQVNFKDYSALASKWRYTTCVSPTWCSGTDLNTDGKVDELDLQLFADFWLEKTR